MAKRPKLLNVRMSDAEHRMLVAIAEADGVNASDLIRQFIRQTYRKLFGTLLTDKD